MKYILMFLVLLLVANASAQTDFERGEAYFKKEQFGKAKPYFESYLKTYSNDKKTAEYLGDIASYSKDWDTAMEYYEQLVDKDESNAMYHFKYGGAMGMKALSISKIRAVTYISDIKYHFERSAELDPKHIEVRWALVEFYIQLPGIIGGSEKKALAYADELAKLSPVDGYLAKGYIAEYTDRPSDAEKYYKKAIDIGGSETTYDKLTQYYEKNNRPKEAIDNANRSLEKHKRNHLNYQIGKISAQYNLDSTQGIKCLHAYIDNYSVKDGVPKDWAYFRLAQIYRNKGDKDKAMAWIEKALSNRPDFKEALQEKRQILSM